MADPLSTHLRELAACRLCGPDVRPVLSRRAASQRIVLVGQAPGRTEAIEGRPFCGPAGKRLDAWMQRVGFTSEAFREHVYLAAVTRCYPGPAPSGRGDRRPSPAEVAACAPHLERELAILRPELVIVVGTLAIERLLGPIHGKLKLEDAVGRSFPIPIPAEGPGQLRIRKDPVRPPGPVAVPLPHPSGASTWFHAPENRDRLERALDLLRREVLDRALAPLTAPGV